MPHIAINSYCNLHCPYCYAQEMFIDKSAQNITIEELNKILNWLASWEEQTQNQIGIIGGEPTLHPQFIEIIENITAFCNKYHASSLLFTNGIKLDEKLIKEIPDNMRILLNYNHPMIYSQKDYEQLQENLKILNEIGWLSNKMSLSMTFCEDIKDYSFFKEILDKYDIRTMRLAVNRANGKWADKEYLLNMKKYFLDMIDYLTKKDNIKHIALGCRIPINLFNLEEQNKIFELIPKEQYTSPCTPQFKIFKDFTMTGCFTHYSLIDCNKYKSFKEFKEIGEFKNND